MTQTNFAKAYTEYSGARTDAPLEFARYAAVAVCCAALGNRLYLDAGWGRIYPSTWTCLVGRSGVRKSTSVDLVSSLLAQADESIELPHDFTREALYEQLAARPCGLLRWREMGSVLKSFSREYNAGIKETLTDFWDSPATVKRRTKASGEVLITRPALTILAAAKPRWFVENTSREDIEGGFIGRWMFVSADANNGAGSFFGTPSTSAQGIQRESLVEHLHSLTTVGQNYPREIVPGEGAREELERWLQGFQAAWEDEDKDPADFAQRAGTQVIKLAMGILACRGPDELSEIPPQAIKQAIELFTYSFDCSQALISMIAGHDKDRDTLDRITALVKEAGGTISRRALCRQSHMTVRRLEEYVQTLCVSGVLESVQERNPQGGPPSTLYRVAKW